MDQQSARQLHQAEMLASDRTSNSDGEIEAMFENFRIAVIVPAYNEENLIGKVIETMPSFVDQIIIVNDCSNDNTQNIIESYEDERIILINHVQNRGLGQTLIDGYLKARELEFDVVAVMAGDAQMNPNDLPKVLTPITSGRAHYVKGNRLLREDVVERMPTHRYFGNNALTLLTKFATGYWHVIDPQCGYTAISKQALTTIKIEEMIQGYGYNADILNMLNLNSFKVCDVEVEPVYGAEVSGIKLSSYIPTVSKLLARLFIRRMRKKYLLREFHPLVFLYLLSFTGLLACFLYAINFFFALVRTGGFDTTMLIFMLNIFSTSLFSLIFWHVDGYGR